MARVLLDFRVSIAGAGRYGTDLIDALKEVVDPPETRVFRRRRGLDGLARMPFTPWGRLAAAKAARVWPADLLHGLHFEVPSGMNIPTVVTVQDLIPLDYPASMNSLRRKVFHSLVGASIKSAESVIAPSRRTAEAIDNHFGESSKVRVIPLGVGPSFSPISSAEKEVAQRLFSDGSSYVAALYRQKPHKNLRSLIKASEKAEGITVVCASVPSGVQLGRAKRAGILNTEQLRLFYGGAEAFVLPSLIEGFGLPALEAMACGCPVICGSGCPAIEFTNEAALVVDVTSPEQIARAIKELIHDDDQRISRSASGLTSAAALTTSRMAHETARLYESLL